MVAPCRITTRILPSGHKERTCDEHDPNQFHGLPEESPRCPYGPAPTEDDFLAFLRARQDASLRSIANVLYPTRGSAAKKGAHHGIAFRAKAADKVLSRMAAKGLVVALDETNTWRLADKRWAIPTPEDDQLG